MNSDIVVFSIIASGALLLCLSLFFSRNQKKGKAHKHHFEKLGGGGKTKKCPRCGTSCKPIHRGLYWDNTSKPYVEYNCQNCGCFFTNNE